NRFSGASKIKTAGLALTYLSACALFQMMDGRTGELTEPLIKLYKDSVERHTGGGAVGAAIAKLLDPFGFGALVIICILIIVGLVILTERSFINGVRNQGTKVYNKTKENLENYRMDAEEKQTKRMEKKASGVTMDINIPKDGLKHNDVREINEKVSQQKDRYSEDIFEIKPLDGEKKETEKAAGSDDTVKAKNDKNERITPFIQRIVEQEQEQETAEQAVVKEPSADETDVLKPVPKKPSADAAQEIHKTEPEDSPAVPQSDPAVKSDNSRADTYRYPSTDLLTKITAKKNGNMDSENKETAQILQQTLQSFGVNVTVADVSCGPSVTRYELLPERGTKVSKIVSLADDIKLNLAAADIRIEAPIPGKAAVGIEVPNKEATGVGLRELLESEEFKNHPSKIAFAAGKDIAGKVIVADIAKMPHLLIAGATGSGKSVCINTIIMSILYKARPDEVKLIMVDPKVVELSMYNGIPHLLIPVVTDPKKASQALNWAVAEMDERYKKFAKVNVRDLKGYNEKVEALGDIEDGEKPEKLPQIVIIIDELADLMMVAPGEVEDAICRLAQLARACGIHLIIATQRPSVNVITGLIKANVPSRIAFSVSSGVDSRTILDMVGAEKLLGKGDMLFYPSGYQKPARAQGAFVSDKDVSNVVEFLVSNVEPAAYNEEIVSAVNSSITMDGAAGGGNDRDQYFEEAGRFVIEKERASIGLIQRFYKVGFNRAARIMDQLCDAGVVGPEEGTKPRKILMTMEEFEEFLKDGK
ncbi:MAG: DNA translocase FtsK, partial [Alistipes sp.]|nr:DNA translocase FtsK [Alistipes sp.]